MDIRTRRQKQQALLTELLERKIRHRARQLYEGRGQVEGFALQAWIQAEAEILENNRMAPLYRRAQENRLTPQEELEEAIA